ncbi:MAG: Ig-like domain-containing protein [Terracidiphilus sp.]
MRKFRFGITYWLATLLIVFIAGCGQETVTVPSVVSTVPANGATSVVINTPISATFSVAMNPSSITSSTFTVTGPGGAVAGAVSYSGLTATFTPAAVLAYGTTYTGTITTGATNQAGTPLLGNYVWTFTTITPAPTVIASIPANGATSVVINTPISATFSEAMNPSSISGSTFTVTGPGGTAVAGTVAYSGVTATFATTANLAFGTIYTATITTGAASVAGTPLGAAYVWSFTTITPPPTVISTIPVNGATGVPLGQVISATFNEAMKCSTLASPAASFVVTGPGATVVAGTVACAGAVATFTPAANLAVNTLYTATITTGAQSLVGTPLAANYVWAFLTLPAPTPPTVISTVPVNGATGVPINQAISATFSVAMNPATIGGATFTVTGPGATAVAGVVTYIPAGSGATFAPAANLAPNTVYTVTITTGAQNLAAVGLAANYVWTFTTGTTVVVAPTVIATIPVNAATAVPLNQIVTATFSTAMNPATINSTTFKLTGPGTTAVPGLLAYAAVGNTLTFRPAANLTASTLFTATITTGAQNLAGTALAVNYVWTFTTGTTVGGTPPQIVSTVPANTATNVPLNQAVSATFTQAMNPLTITTGTFQLTGPGGTAVAGIVSYDAINFIATFTPTLPLIASSSYTALVTNGATNLTGTPLGNTGVPNPWMFITGTVVVPPPVVLGPNILLFGGFGGGAGITNQGTSTVVHGNIGTTGTSTTMTGFYDESVPAVAGVFPCSYTVTPSNMGLVLGSIVTATPPPSGGCINEGNATTFALATQAALEARTAYLTLQALPPGILLATNELGNRTLAPGTYTSASFYQITTGPLTLDAQGDPNASWVFQMGSYLTVGTPTASENVVLINGAQAKNVYWAVAGLPGAVINYGGGGTMVGTVISQPGITVSSPGVAAVTTINGRVLALNASATIVNTVINVP